MTAANAPVSVDKYPELTALIESHKLTCSFKFVPFKSSRNKAEKHPSLNWIFTLKRNEREVLSGDYMQGSGHAPANGATFKIKSDKALAIRGECETGSIYADSPFGSLPSATDRLIPPPPTRDVLYSLFMDASVLDSGAFEDWAADCGYDIDSRAAEKIYNACIQIALKLRAALGADSVEKFQTALQDY